MTPTEATRHEIVGGWLADFTFAAEMMGCVSDDGASAMVAALRSGMVAMGKLWQRDPAIGLALLERVEESRRATLPHGDALVSALIADWDKAGA